MAGSFETSDTTHPTTQRRISKDLKSRQHQWENLKSRTADVIAAMSNKTSPVVRRIYWHLITCHWMALPYFISVTTHDLSFEWRATDGVLYLTHNNLNFRPTQKCYHILLCMQHVSEIFWPSSDINIHYPKKKRWSYVENISVRSQKYKILLTHANLRFR
jgi:hypothetical protein